MWLNQEPSWKATLLWIGLCVKVNLTYSFGMIWLLGSFGVDVPPVRGIEDIIAGGVTYLFSRIDDIALEELVLRVLPLAALVWAKWPLTGILAYAVFSSVVFGGIHGSTYHILVQGVTGFAYALLFLKCGGLQRNYFKGFVAVFVAPLLFNGILFAILAI